MSQQTDIEASTLEVAHSCLSTHRAALDALGLRTDVQTERREEGERRGSEIRIAFWREENLIDVIEDFVFRDGQPTASREELRRWLEDGIREVLESGQRGS
jgi:hypothetical protein